MLPIIRLAPESRLRRGDEVLAAARTPDLSSHNPLPKPSRLSRERPMSTEVRRLSNDTRRLRSCGLSPLTPHMPLEPKLPELLRL